VQGIGSFPAVSAIIVDISSFDRLIRFVRLIFNIKISSWISQSTFIHAIICNISCTIIGFLIQYIPSNVESRHSYSVNFILAGEHAHAARVGRRAPNARRSGPATGANKVGRPRFQMFTLGVVAHAAGGGGPPPGERS